MRQPASSTPAPDDISLCSKFEFFEQPFSKSHNRRTVVLIEFKGRTQQCKRKIRETSNTANLQEFCTICSLSAHSAILSKKSAGKARVTVGATQPGSVSSTTFGKQQLVYGFGIIISSRTHPASASLTRAAAAALGPDQPAAGAPAPAALACSGLTSRRAPGRRRVQGSAAAAASGPYWSQVVQVRCRAQCP